MALKTHEHISDMSAPVSKGGGDRRPKTREKLKNISVDVSSTWKTKLPLQKKQKKTKYFFHNHRAEKAQFSLSTTYQSNVPASKIIIC